MTDNIKKVYEALKTLGKNVLCGKGGFFIKDEGFITLVQARKLTGISAEKRVVKQKILPWGDYATIAMINGIK